MSAIACSRFRPGLLVLGLVAGLAFPATAAAQNACLAAKNKCVSKKVQALVKCHVKAEVTGTPVEANCIVRAQSKFPVCFSKAELKIPCLTTGDTAAIETKADAFASDLVAELDPTAPSPNPCAAKKNKCVTKKAQGVLKCFESAAKSGAPVSQACVDKVRAKFDGSLLQPPNPAKGCFEKIEAKGGCTTLDDTQAIEAKVDSFIEDVLCELGQTPQMCTITSGDDVWVTPPGSTQDFSGNPIPANFFDPNSDPFTGITTFRGIPLTTSPPDALGSIDTIIRRSTSTTLPRAGDQTTVPIEIIALSLTSVQPITVTYNGGMNPELWNVSVHLSSAAPQQQGSMTIRREKAEGGSYDSSLPVLPKFTFTRISDSAVRTLDCGLGGCGGPIVLQLTNSPWTAEGLIGGYDARKSGLPDVPAVQVDADGDNTPDVTTNGNPNNFVPGVEPNRKACELNEHQTIIAGHGVAPDCRDYYVLYEATGPAGPPTVDLDDEFGAPEFGVSLGTVKYLMVPAQVIIKGGFGGIGIAAIAHPDAHELCYDLPTNAFTSLVTLDHQVGGNSQLNVVAGERFLAVPTEKTIGPLPVTPVPLEVNHFECYAATGFFTGAGVKLTDQFRTITGNLGNPVFFCNPVTKNGEPILNAATHLTCYDLSDSTLGVTVNVRNQFGTGTSNVVKSKAFCVPSTLISHVP